VAGYQPGQIHGEEAGPAERVGNGKQTGATGTQQQGVQAFVAAHARQQFRQQAAEAGADQGADTELLNQGEQAFGAQIQARGGDDLDQQHGDENGHRVVQARFHLQSTGHPFVQGHAGAADQAEYRRRVGGADDAAEQQANAP